MLISLDVCGLSEERSLESVASYRRACGAILHDQSRRLQLHFQIVVGRFAGCIPTSVRLLELSSAFLWRYRLLNCPTSECLLLNRQSAMLVMNLAAWHS